MPGIIPPPPPKPRTKRARNNETPASIAAKRTLRHDHRMDAEQDVYMRREDHIETGLNKRITGAPAHMTSNMPAVQGALGHLSEKQARFKCEREAKALEYGGGRTSNLPELAATARMSSTNTAMQFDNFHGGK